MKTEAAKETKGARNAVIRLALGGLMLGFGAAGAYAQNADFIPVDPPGSTSTIVGNINNRGEIAGYFIGSNGTHGFVREPCGSFITFDFPGLLTVNAINAKGEIAGMYSDNYEATRVFVRDKTGTITTIAVPGTGSTDLGGINDRGEIVLHYLSDTVSLREPDGSFITIPIPGATFAWTYGINNRGEIIGGYDTANRIRAFVGYPDGKVVSFDGPGAGQNGTVPLSINDSGDVAGFYYDADNVQHGFVRHADGTLVTFDVPAATETSAIDINNRGDVVGSYQANDGQYHSFVRDSSGTFTSFDWPGAGGTFATSINDRGEIVGTYFAVGDVFDNQHHYAFLRVPHEQCEKGLH